MRMNSFQMQLTGFQYMFFRNTLSFTPLQHSPSVTILTYFCSVKTKSNINVTVILDFTTKTPVVTIDVSSSCFFLIIANNSDFQCLSVYFYPNVCVVGDLGFSLFSFVLLFILFYTFSLLFLFCCSFPHLAFPYSFLLFHYTFGKFIAKPINST